MQALYFLYILSLTEQKIIGLNNELRTAAALPVKRAMYAKFTELMT